MGWEEDTTRLAGHMIHLSLVALLSSPPVCFTAHEKTTLYCEVPPSADGPVTVFDDSAVGTRTLHWRAGSGKLCTSKWCSSCIQRGADARAGSCRSAIASGWTLAQSRSNSLLRKPAALLLGGAVLSLPVMALLLSMPAAAPSVAVARYFAKLEAVRATPTLAQGPVLRAAVALLQFAGAWWFPLVAALGTAVNLFTLVLTAATVVLYLAAVLGRPSRWVSTALANAVGAAAGSYALLLLLRSHGESLLADRFGAVLANPSFDKLMSAMQAHGAAGMLGVSCLPLILHPVVLFGYVSGRSDAEARGLPPRRFLDIS